jgi:AAHS family benzoate transporter-like MFS transporter
LFGLFRFVAGLGLGGLLPTINALLIEYAPLRSRTFVHAVTFTGFPLGGILAAGLAILVIPAFGWRAMFWIGVAPLIFIVPLALKYLPESVEFLVAHDRRREAETLARRFGVPLEAHTVAAETKYRETPTRAHKFRALASLFSRRYVAATILFGIAIALNLLTAYGLATWLPQIMLEAGYPLGSALSFLLALNVAALVGLPIAGAVADRIGSKAVCTIVFVMAAAAIALLSLAPPPVVTYILAGVAGFGTIGLQIQLNAYVAKHYSAGNRATALGWALSVGRLGAMVGPILGGVLIASQLSQGWNFYFFALASFLGAVAVVLIPRSSTAVPVEASAAPESTVTSA